jgi:hypothetical protein
MTIWETLVVSAFTAVIVGPISAWISLRRFRSEKWWERKATSYAAAIEALHGMYDYAAAHADPSGELHPDREKRLAAASVSGRLELSKSASIGSFVMTRTAASIAKDVLTALDQVSRDQPDVEFYAECAALLTKAIESMTAEAKRDLRAK